MTASDITRSLVSALSPLVNLARERSRTLLIVADGMTDGTTADETRAQAAELKRLADAGAFAIHQAREAAAPTPPRLPVLNNVAQVMP